MHHFLSICRYFSEDVPTLIGNRIVVPRKKIGLILLMDGQGVQFIQ